MKNLQELEFTRIKIYKNKSPISTSLIVFAKIIYFATDNIQPTV